MIVDAGMTEVIQRANIVALCIYRSSATAVIAECVDVGHPWPELTSIRSKMIENDPRRGIEYTFSEAGKYFRGELGGSRVHKLAISSFGPFENLNNQIHRNRFYGQISPLQKDLNAGGKNLVQLSVEHIIQNIRTDVVVTTDANALALGELYKRARERKYPFNEYSEFNDRCVEMKTAFSRATVLSLLLGKGVGGGIAYGGGQVWQQHYHPEMGHIPVTRFPGDMRASACSVHDDCITGFLSRDSLEVNGLITERNWILFYQYAAQLIATATYMICPDVITLSGSLIRERPSAINGIFEELDEILRGRRPDRTKYYIRQESDLVFEDYLGIADDKSQILGTVLYGAGIVLTQLSYRNNNKGNHND